MDAHNHAETRETAPAVFATKPEIAKRLRCSLRTVDNWIADGILPVIRIGGPKKPKVLLNVAAVDRAVMGFERGGVR
jgi:excisionase family DNA binding protein